MNVTLMERVKLKFHNLNSAIYLSRVCNFMQIHVCINVPSSQTFRSYVISSLVYDLHALNFNRWCYVNMCFIFWCNNAIN
jgi:hypothetical protein